MAISWFMTLALSGTLQLDQALPIAITSPWRWDSDQCRAVVRSVVGNLACTPATPSPTPILCDSFLRLDGRMYPLRGTTDWFDGGLVVMNAAPGVGNCRRSNGQPLPAQTLPTLVLGTSVLNLVSAPVQGVPMAYGWEFRVQSITGDIICDGAVVPAPALLRDGFEASPPAATYYPELKVWVR